MENNEELMLPAPFQRKDIHLSIHDKICLLIGILTLFPIRLIILVPCFLLAWCFARFGLIKMDETKPASGFRRILQRFNYRIARFIMRICFGFLSPKMTGDLLPPEAAPVMVIAPHTSFFDVWIVCWFEMNGFCSAIVREENKETPFLGPIFRFQQMLFVKRSCKLSRQEMIETISTRVKDLLWGRLIIFPEGTTSNGSCLLPFKRGGFLQGVHQVHPVVVRYPNMVDCTTWTEGNSGYKEATMVTMRAMATLFTRAEVEIMPAVMPEGDPVMFGQLVREAMGERVGLPLYHHQEELKYT